MRQNNGSKGGKLRALWALTNRELKKWYKEPTIFFISIIQPVFWMGLFGKAMNLNGMVMSNPGISPEAAQRLMTQTFGTGDYFSFMAVGMISFVVLFTTMFSGMSIVWDRRLGFLNKVLSTPVPRGMIVFSKVLSATFRSLVQAAIVLVIAFAFGLKVGSTFHVVNILGVFAVVFLICLGLSSFFLMIALRSTRWETQMAIMNLFNLPLMFASNIFFPIAMMPGWLQAVARVNPLTYTTDAIRQLLIYNTNYAQLLFDFTCIGGFMAVFTSIGFILSWKYLSR
jgi:ABC-2 type transport system permease protein